MIIPRQRLRQRPGNCWTSCNTRATNSPVNTLSYSTSAFQRFCGLNGARSRLIQSPEKRSLARHCSLGLVCSIDAVGSGSFNMLPALLGNAIRKRRSQSWSAMMYELANVPKQNHQRRGEPIVESFCHQTVNAFWNFGTEIYSCAISREVGELS